MTRAALPNRRPHEGFEFECWGQWFHAGIGRGEIEGPALEVWINTGKSGTAAETYARDAAVMISLGLQYGVPLEAMRKTVMRDLDGRASGPIGKLVDLVAEEERRRRPTSEAGEPMLPVVPKPGDCAESSSRGEAVEV